MIKTRLAAALSIALLVTPITQAAKYKVVELPVNEQGENSFSAAINTQGQIAALVSSPFNVAIDLSLLDFESAALTAGLTDIEAAKNGDFNQADYEFLLGYIKANDGLQNAQQIADSISYLTTPDTLEYLPGFDQVTDFNNEFSLSTNTQVRDINDSGLAVGKGEGFYKKVAYTDKDDNSQTYVVRDFGVRAFVNLDGNNVALPPTDSLAGGYSEAHGINQNNQVVGYGSTVFLSDSFVEEVEKCQNEEIFDHDDDPATEDQKIRGDVPVEACISSLISALSSAPTDYASLRGHIWQLDDSGNLLETKTLGLLFEPEEDDNVNYASQAVAINDNGIAVGSSNGRFEINNIPVTRNFAVIFEDDQVINLTPDADNNVARTSATISSAVDINNANLVTGYQVKSVNGQNRTKFFVYDMNTQTLTFPSDYFLGSSSVPTDINNNGLVVGVGEVDASLTGRRKEGFLYDHNSEEFFPIRDLLSCNSPYTIVQANGINDQGDIAATALVQRPSRNAKGEIILDDDGNQIIKDTVIAVKLEPIPEGQIDNCEEPEGGPDRERQGASSFWLLPFGLLMLGWRRVKA